MRNRILYPALIWLVLILVACEYGRVGVRVGDKLPSMTLQTLVGDSVPLSRFRGRVLVINFWATWCQPCRQEMPALAALSREVDPDKVVVMALSVDSDVNLVKEFNLKYGTQFAAYIDQGLSIADGLFNLQGYPQTLIVDPQGVLVSHIQGVREWQLPDVRRQLEALYEGESLSGALQSDM